MKRWGKWLLIGAGMVVALLLIALILVKVLLTPERVRTTLLPLAQQQLGREVRLGAIEIGLFSGVTVRDFAVLEADRQTVFVGAGELKLRYRFWPLLRGQVEISEILLQAPRLRVVRQADGRFNFSDLTERQQQTAPAQPAAEERPLDLRIASFALHDGTVEFIDEAVATPPFRTELNRLELTARELSLQQAFPFELSLQLAGAPLNVTGTANAATKRGQVQMRLQGLDLTAFAPYYQQQLPGRLQGARLDLDLNLEGGAEQLATRGNVAVKGLDLTLASLKDAPVRAELTLNYDLQAELKQLQLTFAESRLTYNGLALTFAGTVKDYATAPQLDLTLALPGLELHQLAAALPAAQGASLRAMEPAGTVQARIHLVGPTAEPLKLLREGEIAFNQVAVTAGGMRPTVAGRLLLAGDTLKSDGLGVQLGADRLQVQLTSPHLLARPLSLSVAVSGERFDLTPPVSASGTKTSATVSPAAAEEIGPFDLPLRLEATVKIKQLRYSGVALEDFDLRARLAENILTVEPLTARLAGGTLRVEKRVDLSRRGLAYAVQCRLRQVQLDALVDGLYPTAKGTFFGALDLDLDLAGTGTLPATLKRNLDGTGSFAIRDGKLTGAGLAGGLAAFFGEDDLRVLRFRQFGGTGRIRQGQVELASSLAGDDVKLLPQGTVGLDGALNLGLDSRFSPRLTQKLTGKGDLGRLVADEQGWGRLPLRVKGTLTEPKVKLDSEALTRQAADAARQQLERALEKRLKGKDGEPGKVRLEDALKGLLGR